MRRAEQKNAPQNLRLRLRLRLPVRLRLRLRRSHSAASPRVRSPRRAVAASVRLRVSVSDSVSVSGSVRRPSPPRHVNSDGSQGCSSELTVPGGLGGELSSRGVRKVGGTTCKNETSRLGVLVGVLAGPAGRRGVAACPPSVSGARATGSGAVGPPAGRCRRHVGRQAEVAPLSQIVTDLRTECCH